MVRMTESLKISTVDPDICSKIVIPSEFGTLTSYFVPKKGELTNFHMSTDITVSIAMEKREISSKKNTFEYNFS